MFGGKKLSRPLRYPVILSKMRPNLFMTIAAALLLLASCSSSDDENSRIDSEIYFAIAKEYIAAGEPEKALREIRSAIETDPENYDAYFMKCETEAKMGRFDEAFKTVEKLGKQLPPDKAYLEEHWLGVVHYHRNELEKAAELFEASSRKKPDFVINYVMLGQIYTKSQKHDRAIKNYLEWTKLEPESDRAWGQLGIGYVGAGDFKRAKEALDKSLSMNPDSAETYNYLGRWAVEQKLSDTAESYFVKSLGLDGSNSFTNLNYGQFLMLKARHEEAYPYLKKAYDLNPEVVFTLFWLGKYHRMAKEYSEAYGYYNKAIELNPAFWPARMGIADMCIETGKDLQKAVKIMKDGIAGSSGSRRGYFFYLARLELAQNNPASALDYSDQTLALLDKSAVNELADLRKLRGRIYEKLGQPKKAKAEYAKAPPLAP